MSLLVNNVAHRIVMHARHPELQRRGTCGMLCAARACCGRPSSRGRPKPLRTSSCIITGADIIQPAFRWQSACLLGTGSRTPCRSATSVREPVLGDASRQPTKAGVGRPAPWVVLLLVCSSSGQPGLLGPLQQAQAGQSMQLVTRAPQTGCRVFIVYMHMMRHMLQQQVCSFELNLVPYADNYGLGQPSLWPG